MNEMNYISPKAKIGDNCIIFPFVSILDGTRMGSHNKVHQGSVIGALPQDFNFRGEKSECIIGDNNIIRENVVINRATHRGGQTIIGNDNVLMEGAHISHDTKVGNACVFGYGTKIAGDCQIDDGVIFSSSVIENAKTHVGVGAMIQAGTTFSKDVPPYIICTKRSEYGGVNYTMGRTYGVDEKTLKRTSPTPTASSSTARPPSSTLPTRLSSRCPTVRRYAPSSSSCATPR